METRLAGRSSSPKGWKNWRRALEQSLYRPPRLLPCAPVGLGDINGVSPAELVGRRLVTVLPRLVAIPVRTDFRGRTPSLQVRAVACLRSPQRTNCISRGT
jgi:hypothetical protein